MLLDNDADLDLVRDAWIRACIKMSRQEAIRLLVKKKTELSEFCIGARQKQMLSQVGLGYSEGKRVFVLTDAHGSLVEGSVEAPGNACEGKADDRVVLVPPKGFKLPSL
jgi:hypothetical protein